jgi:hypothetical protein
VRRSFIPSLGIEMLILSCSLEQEGDDQAEQNQTCASRTGDSGNE